MFWRPGRTVNRQARARCDGPTYALQTIRVSDVNMGEDEGNQLQGQAGDKVAVEGLCGGACPHGAPFGRRQFGEQGVEGVVAGVRGRQGAKCADEGVHACDMHVAWTWTWTWTWIHGIWKGTV